MARLSKPPTGLTAQEVGNALHNGVCQTLTGIQLHISVLARRMKKSSSDFTADIEELQNLMERARGELNDIVQKLPR